MVELYKADTLRFTFPELHEDAVLDIRLRRTLRVPDDQEVHHLPLEGESLSMEHVADYADYVSETWKKHGGVMLPMYQSEAMWIEFESPTGYPFAVKVATGKCCAITGESWMEGLVEGERVTRKETINLQNYVVVPPQKFLDGFCTNTGVVRQFVAMPLGSGATVEEQLTGKAEFGGLQFQVYPLEVIRYRKANQPQRERRCAMNLGSSKPEPVQNREEFPSCGGWWSIRRDKPKKKETRIYGCMAQMPQTVSKQTSECAFSVNMDEDVEESPNEFYQSAVIKPKTLNCWSSRHVPIWDMGLCAGAEIKQTIFKDDKGLVAWDCSHTTRVFVHLMNADQWVNVTRKIIDRLPLTREVYERNGLPWSDAYTEREPVLGSQKLANLQSVEQLK